MQNLRITFFFWLALICALRHGVQAQQLEFQQLTIEQGLPSSEVYNLYEDRKGYIWACTEYGVVKHDGTRFIPVCKNLPFEESAFYAIKESPAGNLYLANSKAHIYTVTNDSAFRVKGMENISKKIIADKEVIFDILIDAGSNIYFSTLNSTYLYSNNKVISLSERYANDSGGTYFKKVGADYALIKAKTKETVNKNSFFKIIDEKDKVIRQVHATLYPSDRSRFCMRDGSCYFINLDKLILLDEQGHTKTLAFKHRIISFELSADRTLWIGTNNGLFHLDTSHKVLAHYFKGCVVSDILFDHRNGIWISTIERGVYYCKNKNNIYYNAVTELSSKITLLKKINERFFIGTSEGNLFEKKHNQLTKLNLGSNISSITDLIFFQGKYIVGTKSSIMAMGHDINMINGGTFLPSYDSRNVLSSYGFVHDSPALILICPTGVFKYSNFETKTLAISADRPRCIARRQDKTCLVGTTNGVFLLKDTSYNKPDFLLPLNDKIILNLMVDKAGNVWICTKGYGLYKLSQDNQLTKSRNIPSNVVNNINIIDDTTVLLSTDKGLFINKYDAINKSSSWKLLVNNEVIGADIFGDDIFIAAKQGLITINKNRALPFTGPNLRFYLESITVNNTKISPNNVQLSHNENNIYFNFDILAYETPGYVISYELEGPDPIKGITTGKQIYLHNLPPGHYTLSAKPFYSGIHDQHVVIKIPFYVRPALWQTKLFLAVAVLSLTTIVLFIWHSIKQKEKRKTKIARQLAEYRLTALKAQINPHFISNSLTAIQQLMLKKDTDAASQYMAKFSLLLRNVLKYSDKYATRLADEINLIGTNVELEQLRFSNKFVFEQHIDNNIYLNEIFVPPLITQPIIENAIWHGLLPLNNKRIPKLILKVEIVDGKLIISIIDNGVGMQDAATDKTYGNKEPRGTWLVRNWIDNLNQLSTVKGTMVNYIDLYDDLGNPAGTRVDIIFPVEALNRLRNEKHTIRDY